MSAPRAFWVYRAGFAFCWALMTTLSLLFQVQVARLDPVQLVVVGTVLEASCFLGEIPTSVVADRFSRRASVIIGLVVAGVGFALQAVPSFGAILAAQVVWGIGYTFVSSADVAWVVDEVGGDRVQPVLVRGTQLALAAGLVGTVAAGALGLLGLGLPLVVSGAGMVLLAGWLLFRMPETWRPAAASGPGLRSAFRAAGHTFVEAVRASRASRLVRAFCLIGLLTGLSSEVVDRLWTARVVNQLGLPPWFDGLPHASAVWFTGFALVGQALALGTSVLANRISPAVAGGDRPHRLLAVLTGLQVAAVVGFAVSGLLLPALLALWVRDATRAVAEPVQNAWLHRDLDPATRATVGSVVTQADALGQVAGGPPLGALATRTSIPLALLVAAVVQAPTVALFARLGRPVGRADGAGRTGTVSPAPPSP
ncbi:DHA3 family tetracycline resistance protein-like MFS transporter [Friedmanniella endophytica]|uniref:DHA3 family tetracycline resistance protein-like MFS transporter n=1 Tax=Microlunatus kandeliicorticis TaxID=1759536 RepID=A0A7W3IV86_9ACTN|nr:DHA3 family tetracycline resistance protein-like MFS transporter [Microlunatus kandeliicorticis]